MTQIKAILGPTNTGKTHYAIERMIAHGTGMIGLPLRLLAREVYDRVVAQKGPAHVALLTGEERIHPPSARYFVCTVESMPVDIRTDFVAIDEIQLAEDEDRGHVFTDRILKMRGNHETLLIGADTMRPLLQALKIGAVSDSRERFSQLRYAGHTKITKLPKRTAIVAFSAEDVYAIAELLRRQRGGAAVVMGALSPRTRNAQVAMYQSGVVDYIVATDAIGMGLNLDVDRVVFASLSKFDGRRHRNLTPAECGQIAGRAGRFRTDGEFGETANCPPFAEEVWKAIEAHRFDPVDAVQWRSSDLDFRSLRALIRSLEQPSGNPALIHNPHALDEWVLRRMSEDSAIGPDVTGERRVRRLWDLARLPDFRKAGPEAHARLVLGLAETLMDPDARLGDEGLRQRLDGLAMSRSGDIAQIQQNLAMIRTWTYASHRPDWLEHPEVWQQRTREIEDALSDALHEALTARFVDKRTTMLLAGLRKEEALVTDLTPAGEVTVEGHLVGRLRGLVFEPILDARTLEGRAVRGAALAAVRPMLSARLAAIAAAPDAAFRISDTGEVEFQRETIARLAKGHGWIKPRVELVGAVEADATERQAAIERLARFIRDEIARSLPVHARLSGEGGLSALEGLPRGIAFRLIESGAAIDLRKDSHAQRLTPQQRETLKAEGLRAGRVAAYVPEALKPAAQRVIAALRAVESRSAPRRAPEGAGSFRLDGSWPEAELNANGYLVFGARALRADLAERLGWEIAKRKKEAGKNLFTVPIELASMISCSAEDWPGVLKGLGLSPAERDAETGVVRLWRFAARMADAEGIRPRSTQRDGRARARGPKPKDDGGAKRPAGRAPALPVPPRDSPFSALAVLLPPPDPPHPKKPRRDKPRAAKFTYKPFI